MHAEECCSRMADNVDALLLGYYVALFLPPSELFLIASHYSEPVDFRLKCRDVLSPDSRFLGFPLVSYQSRCSFFPRLAFNPKYAIKK